MVIVKFTEILLLCNIEKRIKKNNKILKILVAIILVQKQLIKQNTTATTRKLIHTSQMHTKGDVERCFQRSYY